MPYYYKVTYRTFKKVIVLERCLLNFFFPCHQKGERENYAHHCRTWDDFGPAHGTLYINIWYTIYMVHYIYGALWWWSFYCSYRTKFRAIYKWYTIYMVPYLHHICTLNIYGTLYWFQTHGTHTLSLSLSLSLSLTLSLSHTHSLSHDDCGSAQVNTWTRNRFR